MSWGYENAGRIAAAATLAGAAMLIPGAVIMAGKAEAPLIAGIVLFVFGAGAILYGFIVRLARRMAASFEEAER